MENGIKKLPSDFSLDRYGLHVRLVNESDAEFIVKLRTDPLLGRFIHETDNDVAKQVEWIRKYKEREAEGLDYYFIYSYKNEYMGMNRIYGVDKSKNIATGGSFVFKRGCKYEIPILAVLIQFDIAFNMLNINTMLGDIRLGNKKVIRFHKILNVHFTGQDDLNLYYDYSRDAFMKSKTKIEGMLLKDGIIPD